MNIQTIKTDKITPGGPDLFAVLDKAITSLEEGSIVAITSKIVSICEGRVIPFGQADREELIVQESDLYLSKTLSKYGHHFSITDHTLISSAGIDESNGQDHYILWPKDSQATANEAREYLVRRFGLENVGVIITDSTCQPLRRGTLGIGLAHSGFNALHDYIGQPDLFDRPFKVSKASISSGLAAAAVLVMGEGTEQTPIAIITDTDFVEFQPRNPNDEEMTELRIPIEEDLFGPFLVNPSIDWKPGQRNQRS
ncbi:putative folate metabolism gamma-glutamate ligase [soil metagenome]